MAVPTEKLLEVTSPVLSALMKFIHSKYNRKFILRDPDFLNRSEKWATLVTYLKLRSEQQAVTLDPSSDDNDFFIPDLARAFLGFPNAQDLVVFIANELAQQKISPNLHIYCAKYSHEENTLGGLLIMSPSKLDTANVEKNARFDSRKFPDQTLVVDPAHDVAFIIVHGQCWQTRIIIDGTNISADSDYKTCLDAINNPKTTFSLRHFSRQDCGQKNPENLSVEYKSLKFTERLLMALYSPSSKEAELKSKDWNLLQNMLSFQEERLLPVTPRVILHQPQWTPSTLFLAVKRPLLLGLATSFFLYQTLSALNENPPKNNDALATLFYHSSVVLFAAYTAGKNKWLSLSVVGLLAQTPRLFGDSEAPLARLLALGGTLLQAVILGREIFRERQNDIAIHRVHLDETKNTPLKPHTH